DFNPQSGFSNGDEGSHWLAPGKMRSIATGGRQGAPTPRAPTPKARTKGPTGATNGSAIKSKISFISKYPAQSLGYHSNQSTSRKGAQKKPLFVRIVYFFCEK